MTNVIYVHSKCSVCKKALEFLKTRNIDCVVKDIQLTPPSLEELQKMLRYKSNEVRKLFNTSGELYRALELSKKLETLSVQEVLCLLEKNGMLVKRPFFISQEKGLVGFRLEEWENAFLK
jgi:arsenate reductase (glutaredoxin)